MAGKGKYSCKTASETREWIQAIIEFIKPYRFLIDAHVVNFFKDRLWEAVDKEWMECLKDEPVENLLLIPSGVVQAIQLTRLQMLCIEDGLVLRRGTANLLKLINLMVQDHWPLSLKEYVLTIQHLSIQRQQAVLKEVFPGLCMTELNNVLAQGMNHKKRHEIEALAAVVSSIARTVECNTIIDVGAGQGYLAQVLSFEYQLSVIAVDACSHHGRVTDARAERIKRYYASKMRKTRAEGEVSMPKTVTCQVLSPSTLTSLSNSFQKKDVEMLMVNRIFNEHTQESSVHVNPSLVLAGLHACGDLSVTMLRTLLECEEVRAVISIGCCYNLLTEGANVEGDPHCGFPMSTGVKRTGLSLGKKACDLACQSAERWRGMGKALGLQNFELHAFRAAFQLVLLKHYPDIMMKSPTIGRQGKALRRQHQRKVLESNIQNGDSENSTELLSAMISADCRVNDCEDISRANDALMRKASCQTKDEEIRPTDQFSLFEKFCASGLSRLGIGCLPDSHLLELWEDIKQYIAFLGPYWSLRAALGPLLETVILLDRLLFLQEHEKIIEAAILPLFDPVLSPRNVALIAKKI